MKEPANTRPVTLRAILLGVSLLPLNAYWIISLEIVWYWGGSTGISLFYNAVFTLFVLALVNLGIRRRFPRFALHDAELLVVYGMLTVGTAMASHDMFQILVPAVGHGFWFATSENEWTSLIQPYLPKWLTVQDRAVLQGYYLGESSLYTAEHLRGWLLPAAMWCLFAGVLVFVMLCFNALVRRQWTEQEKLAYPIIQLPLELANGTQGFIGSRVIWLGFIPGYLLDQYNNLRWLFPVLPSNPLNGQNIGAILFTEKPWNAISDMWLDFNPFIIGLGYFVPLDLSFSCWFFYLVWQLERVFGAAAGFRSLPGFPYRIEQAAGGYLVLALLALWVSRRHLANILRHVSGKRVFDREEEEPFSYAFALAGVVFGSLFIVGFCLMAGMSLWAVITFFALYGFLSLAVTRMRAELGTPVHDLHFAGPEEMMTLSMGTQRIGTRNLTILSLFWFLTRAYRGHPMPVQLEGLKLAERVRLNNRRFAAALTIAVFFGGVAAFWAFLDLAYRNGTTSRMVGPGWWFGYESFNRLQTWLTTPMEPNYPRLGAHIVGGILTVVLAMMRARFVWWPLHPAGYAVSSGWSMNHSWSCIFIAWLVKWVVLRFYGMRAHGRVGRFFMGVVLGQATAKSVWGLARLAGLPVGIGRQW